jgi:cytochrome c-type biogenesis protein CcmF
VKNRSHLRSEHKLESLVSRESSFLFNNLLLLVACFTVLWGTLFPVLSEWVVGHKVTVGPPFFNRVNIPVALLLLVLTAVGPLLAWRQTSLASLRHNFKWPAVGAAAVAVALLAGGIRPWEDQSYFYALVAISLAALVTFTVASEFYRGGRVIARHTGKNLLASMVQLTRRNTRRYGGYVVHFGVVVIIIGLSGAAFNIDKEQEMPKGAQMQIGSYRLICDSFTEDDNANYRSEWAILKVMRGDKQIATMYPEQRFYKSSGQPATIVANRSTLKEDLYLVYAGRNQDTGVPIIRAHVNPLVMWIWIGVQLIVAGTILALIPNSQAVKLTAAARMRVPQSAAAETVGAND